MIGYIYQIENLVTHESYIGQTIDINRRRNTHFNELRNNKHENPKLQNAWNKYGEQEFHFRYWKFEINSREELNQLENEYIEKYNSLASGYNLVPGGGTPPLRQKVNDDDIVTFLCVQQILGDGYGHTCEQIFEWSRGTASTIKLKKGYLKAWNIYNSMTPEQQLERGQNFINSQELRNKALKRQLNQGGCSKAYSLTADDYNFAFAAQSLGYNYTQVANYLEIKPNTIKDWFSGRARVKEREKYEQLSDNEKQLIIQKVKDAQLELYIKDSFINKKEDDVLDFLCYDLFYKQNDMAIQRLFNWSEGTCYSIRKPINYKASKAKVSLMTEQEQRERANKILNQLIGHA